MQCNQTFCFSIFQVPKENKVLFNIYIHILNNIESFWWNKTVHEKIFEERKGAFLLKMFLQELFLK